MRWRRQDPQALLRAALPSLVLARIGRFNVRDLSVWVWIVLVALLMGAVAIGIDSALGAIGRRSKTGP